MDFYAVKDEIFPFIAPYLRRILCQTEPAVWDGAEEIRVGVDRPVCVYTKADALFLDKQGALCRDINDAYIATKPILEQTMELLTGGSVYAVADQIRNGYITLPKGHRAGITGSAVLKEGEISYIKDISEVNFRIKREVKGAANPVMQSIVKGGKVQNTLIIAPPQCGKTTLLRDIARKLAGNQHRIKVGIVDERGEIAAMYGGIAQNDVGIHVSVLDACPKDKGMMLLIRSMAPSVIITDEIGTPADMEAIRQALCCGVKIITTIHGYSLSDVQNRSALKGMLDIFETYIVLSKSKGTGTIESITEALGEEHVD